MKPSSLALRLLPLLAAIVATGTANAQTEGVPSAVGTVTHLSGLVTARRADGSTKLLAVKSQIREGDTLVTENETYVRIQFVDDAELVLRPASRLVVTAYVYEPEHPEHDRVAMDLVSGGFRSVTGLLGKRNHDAIRFNTPGGEIQVRGTTFVAQFCQNPCGGGGPVSPGKISPQGLYVSVLDGQIVLANSGGQQAFQAGQFGYTPNLTRPPVIVPPTPSMQFTPPPSFSSTNKPSGPATGSKAASVSCVVQ